MDIALTGIAEADTEICRIEPEDFDAIVARHQKQIYRILLCMVRDADVADTLTQECFLRAFRKRGSFRGRLQSVDVARSASQSTSRTTTTGAGVGLSGAGWSAPSGWMQ